MTDQPIGLPKPPLEAEQDQRQQLQRMEQVLIAQIVEAERLLLTVREFRVQQQLIYLLNGAIIGIVAFKAWAGL